MPPVRKIFLLLVVVCSIVCFHTAVASENDDHSHDDSGGYDDGDDNEQERDVNRITDNPDNADTDAAPVTTATTKMNANATSTTGKDRDIKNIIAEALAGSKKVTPSKAVKFAQRHRNAIFLTLAITAFHREITQLLGKLLFKSVKDPKTGQVVRRLHFPIRPTTVLKFIVFVEVIRRMQRSKTRSAGNDLHSGSGDSDSSSLSSLPAPIAALLLLGGSGNPAMMMFLLRLLLPEKNTAYVPPIRQHYTFERVNERYQKDGMAFQKAAADQQNKKSILFMPRRQREFDLSSQMHNATSLSEYIRMSVFHKQAAGTKQAETTTKRNETIVIMDWTDLDSSISHMEVLRDEVSFLLDTHQKTLNDTNSPKLDEVVLLLESPGGSAADYSLASQQILRLRNKGIRVTVCVDKVAASGKSNIDCKMRCRNRIFSF